MYLSMVEFMHLVFTRMPGELPVSDLVVVLVLRISSVINSLVCQLILEEKFLAALPEDSNSLQYSAWHNFQTDTFRRTFTLPLNPPPPLPSPVTSPLSLSITVT